jgi:hypothetical protein
VRRITFALGLVITAGLAGFYLTRMYSPADRWKPFANRTREFLDAAIARDSAGVARLAASPEITRWALDAAGRNPSPLAGFRGFRKVGGSQSGEATLLIVGMKGGACDREIVAVELVGNQSEARVRSISAPCLASP